MITVLSEVFLATKTTAVPSDLTDEMTNRGFATIFQRGTGVEREVVTRIQSTRSFHEVSFPKNPPDAETLAFRCSRRYGPIQRGCQYLLVFDTVSNMSVNGLLLREELVKPTEQVSPSFMS